MHVQFGEHSAPDFGFSIVRQRLIARLDGAGTRPVVIVGPSGAGKSVLAAQFAHHSTAEGLWVSVGGAVFDAGEICDLMWANAPTGGVKSRARDRRPAEADSAATLVRSIREADCGRGVFVVLDDVGRLDDDACAALEQLGSSLWRSSTRLIVTTRSVQNWPAATLCQWVVVDEGDLALTPEEAHELASGMELHVSPDDVDEVCEATAGHVALCAAMLVQAARQGLKLPTARAVSLNAWLDRVFDGLEPTDRLVLEFAVALRTGSIDELRAGTVDDAAARLRAIGTLLPLIRVSQGMADVRFHVHDIVDAYVAERPDGLLADFADQAVHALVARGDYTRACEILLRNRDDDATRAWLINYGERAFEDGHISALGGLFEHTRVSSLMSEASVLVLWSRVCLERGQFGEALAKAKAARLLAEHQRDLRAVRDAVAQTLLSSRYLGDQNEVEALAEEIVASRADFVDDMLVAEALFCIGYGRIARGDLRAAEAPFRAVLETCKGAAISPRVVRLAQNSLAVMPALLDGDFQGSRRALAALTDVPTDLPSVRVMVKGNMAQCVIECGRTERAEALIRSVLEETSGYGLYAGAYIPILGQVKFVAGDTAGGLGTIREGIRISTAAGDLANAAVDRIGLSQALRASGAVEESLSEAEQALETLSVADTMGFRRLAALEVAASLLAGNDVVAARDWISIAGDDGPIANPFHSIRAALLTAECDRRGSERDSAVARIVEFASYIRSENANLLLAMYCRAFPSMLGMVALAIGVQNLPAHMLRMIPPESAEVILVETHTWLDDENWRAMGTRLLGDEEFAKFLARDGLPVCHVHFFGGLEVSIGGRSIREKDWRKRKARLLCAMLVLRRGQDVPREQLLEYLFPEMEPERAKNNLYVVWSTMKSVLMGDGGKGAPLPYFEAVGGVCRSVRENLRCDVDDFDKLLASAQQHEQAGQLADALRDYERLSSMYRGDLLPGDVYDDWFAEVREHYRMTFVNAMLAAGEILMNADDPGNALVYARRAIQSDPLREDLYQVALRCQIAAGQRSSAIDTYLQCRMRLSEDLGLDPSAETKSLYEQILAMEDKPRAIPLDPMVD